MRFRPVVPNNRVSLEAENQMSAPENRFERIAASPGHLEAGLFGWRGGGVVLLGELTGDRWIVARGWLGRDQLTDVRRWSFDNPRAFSGQIRRLAREATGDSRAAAAAAAAATDWAATLVG